MIGDLSKLLGRDFVVGFFLPSVAFLCAVAFLVHLSDEFGAAFDVFSSQPLYGSTLALIIAWLLATTLMALNRLIVRGLSGYGVVRPLLVFLERRQRSKFRTLQRDVERLKGQRKQCPDEWQGDSKARSELIRKSLRLATHFPDDSAWILPTAFGNTLRAAEVYPRVVYGLDGAKGWERLAAVVSDEYRQVIEQARASVNFWINLWVFALIYAMLVLLTALWVDLSLSLIVTVLATIATIIVFPIAARQSAVVHGDRVRAAYDVFLPALYEKLGFPGYVVERRQVWQQFSKVITYRKPIESMHR